MVPISGAKLKKCLTIWLFHSSFTFFVLLYLVMGASIIRYTEGSPELTKRYEKFDQIMKLREKITQKMQEICLDQKLTSPVAAESELKPLLKELSLSHEYDDRFSIDRQKWTDNIDEVKPLWTFYASVLYAMTVLTATGYDRLSPQTSAGKIFAVGFGLFGIPLMFITAANIGSFLSKIVVFSCTSLGRFYRRHVATKIWPRRLSTRLTAVNRLNSVRKSIYGLWFNQDSPTDQKSIDNPEIHISNGNNNDFLDNDYQNQVPIFLVILMIGGYCSLGSFMFTRFENGPVWTFFYGFFFSFNTITTVTLGDIRVDDGFYLVLVVCYCIVGLAVVTMCVDLMSVRFKILFTKLHYHGRKLALKKARARSKKVLEKRLAAALREATEMAAAIKRIRHSIAIGDGSNCITSTYFMEDIEKIVMEKPTFMPKNIDSIPWADDQDENTYTSTTVQSMEAYGDYI